MNAPAPKRPPMLAAACAYLGGLAAIQSIRAMVLVSTWNAENGADKVAPLLRALRDGGMSQASAESAYKVFLTVLAVLAAAGVVFAVYTARGDRASRVGLTVVMTLVGIFFFLGATGGSFFDAVIGALAIAFTVRLWTGESKAWFRALRTGEPMVLPVKKPSKRAAEKAAAPAAAVVEPVAGPAQPVHPVHPGCTDPQVHAGSERLPKSVSVAGWVTLVGSIVVGGMSALALLTLGLIGNDYESLMRDSPFSDRLVDSGMDYDQLYRASLLVSGLCVALSIGGIAASSLTLARKRSAGVFLFVMAVVTTITSIVFFPVGLPWTAASIVVIVQLRKPESKRWFVKT